MKTISEAPHVSYSQVTTFRDCPRRWLWDRQFPERHTTDLTRIVGQAYHYAAYADAVHQMSAGKPLPEAELVATGTQHYKDSLATGTVVIAEGQNEEQWLLLLEGMLRCYHKHGAPNLPKPMSAEQQVSMELIGTEFQTKGVIDFIGTDGVIIDHKTSGRAPTNSHPERPKSTDKADVKRSKADNRLYMPTPLERLQMAVYVLLVKKVYGNDWKYQRSEIWTMSRTARPQLYRKVWTVTDADMQMALNEIAWLIDQISQESDFRPNFQAQYCKITGCSHYSECHEQEGITTTEEMVAQALGLSDA